MIDAQNIRSAKTLLAMNTQMVSEVQPRDNDHFAVIDTNASPCRAGQSDRISQFIGQTLESCGFSRRHFAARETAFTSDGRGIWEVDFSRM